jgi:hypothetical protein
MRVHEDLRVSYLRNQITEEQVQRVLQRRDKDIQKRHEQCVTDVHYVYNRYSLQDVTL